MSTLTTQIKSKLFISSARPSMHPLDGAYASVLHGRSLDFEDLRAYEMGDQVRDIDWRASARLGSVVVKRTRATRMQTVIFLVDTGKTMTGLAPDERSKRDLAIMVTGILGFLTIRHGDDISVIRGDADVQRSVQGGRSEAALEHALRTIRDAIDTATAPGSIDALLRAAASTISKRAILVVVAGEEPFTDETEHLVRRLRVQHDMLWLTIADADPVLPTPSKRARADVITGWRVPSFVQGDQAVVDELSERRAAEAAQRDALLDRWEISHATLTDQDTVVAALLSMLHRRSRAPR